MKPTTYEADGLVRRICRGCDRDLVLCSENFYRSPNAYYSGFEYRCKPCERERARWRNMLRTYGLTPDDYAVMLTAQDGHCATCPSEPPANGMLDVDHDHATGMNRGLLCRQCNVVLGLVNEDITRLARLAEYLRNNTLP